MRILVTTSKYGADWKRHDVNHEVAGGIVSFTFPSYSNQRHHRKNALSPRARSKWDRCFMHRARPGYDVYVHTDSTVAWKSPDAVVDFVKNLQGNEWIGFRHPQRDDVLEEAKYIEGRIRGNSAYHINRYAGEDLIGQARHYKQLTRGQMPVMMENTIFAYTSALASRCDVMRDWFAEIMMWTMQDQISLPYVLSKHGVKVRLARGTCKQNEWTTWTAKDHFK